MDPVTERELRLISLAMAFGLDSCEVEECCGRHGLDYDTSEIGAIRRAVMDDFGMPGLFGPRRLEGREA